MKLNRRSFLGSLIAAPLVPTADVHVTSVMTGNAASIVTGAFTAGRTISINPFVDPHDLAEIVLAAIDDGGHAYSKFRMLTRP